MVKSLTLFLFILSIVSNASAQDTRYSKFKPLPAKLNFENNCNGAPEIKNSKKDQVAILFFQDFSDSVMIQANQKNITTRYIAYDDNLFSTGFTGLNFTQVYPDSLNTVRLNFLKEGSFIEFKLDKTYPFYSVHFYKPRTYYVTGHKCMLSLK